MFLVKSNRNGDSCNRRARPAQPPTHTALTPSFVTQSSIDRGAAAARDNESVDVQRASASHQWVN